MAGLYHWRKSEALSAGAPDVEEPIGFRQIVPEAPAPLTDNAVGRAPANAGMVTSDPLMGDWRERPELVARFQAAYLEERNNVEALDGPWYANEKIGSKAMAQVMEHPSFREIVPTPDVGFLQELPERDLNEAAHLLRDTIILNWSLGTRPFAPYADKSLVGDTMANGARTFSIPVTTILQDIVGKERFDWPSDMMLEAGMLRDQAIFDASHLRATQIACQTASARAVARVGIPADAFHVDQDLPQFSTEYKAAVDAEKDLSDRYLEDIRELVARYGEEDDSGDSR